MTDLTKFSDAELVWRILRAQREVDRWHERALRCGHYLMWLVDKTPRGQEAHHLWLMWATLLDRLYHEEDRRGGNDALNERLSADQDWRGGNGR